MRFIKIALFFAATVFSFHVKLYAQNDKPFTVVIDAGHGGKDPGNRGNKYYEKKIVLNIALKTGNDLSEPTNTFLKMDRISLGYWKK